MSNSRIIFLNIAVRDLAASKAFFEELGFEFNPTFTNDEAACMVISEQAFAMLHSPGSFERFTVRPTADPTKSTEVILAVSADSREEVDALADKALQAGGSAARDAEDYGFMYQRSFHDPDGHLWEVAWMDPKAIQDGPPAEADAAA